MSEERIANYLSRDLYTLEDENNPRGSNVNNIWPSTVLDQVFDEQSPTKKTLRQIIADLRQEIITGGRGNIVFPVTSVNGMTEDVVITPATIGLGRVDNTRDIDKPLSTPQRQAVEDIISSYNFKVNMQELYDHIHDTSNPHGVTFEQLNQHNEITSLVDTLIAKHNLSTDSSIHPELRRSLSQLWLFTEELNDGLNDRFASVYDDISSHIDDSNAHPSLFVNKEDVANKVRTFNDITNSDYSKYPSTKAIVEYVTQKLVEFNDSLPGVENWVDDIKVIDKRSLLPTANANTHRRAYFIRNGETSQNEVAICRLDTNGKYTWDISTMGTYSKYNPDHFTDTSDGLSINMDSVVDYILDEHGALDTSLSKILKDYYSKKELDDMHLIYSISIVPGTMNGTIRYYINNDMMTMSEDVAIPGLKRLAYLEWITEKELADNAVRDRHIVSEAIARRHVQKKAINAERMTCNYGRLLGNLKNVGEDTAHEVTVPELAEYISTYPGLQLTSVGGPVPYHRWRVNLEYPLGDGSYGMRFKGMISVQPNVLIKIQLSEIIAHSRYEMMEAHGSWVYQSDPEECTIMGGSNITGHTFGTVTMSSKGLFFESISIGDRKRAMFDIWVRYLKTSESYDYLEPGDNGSSDSECGCIDECTTIENSVISEIYNGTYTGSMEEPPADEVTGCAPMSEETVNKIWETGQVGDIGETNCDGCTDISDGYIQDTWRGEIPESDRTYPSESVIPEVSIDTTQTPDPNDPGNGGEEDNPPKVEDPSCADNCTTIEDIVISDLYTGTYKGSMDEEPAGEEGCAPMEASTVNTIWKTGEIGEDGDTNCNECTDILPGYVQDVYNGRDPEETDNE